MTFPTIAATATTTSSDNPTSFAVTMPSGIEAGDLLIVVVANDDAYPESTPNLPTTPLPAGWNVTRATSTTIVGAQVFWKIAAGSDTLTCGMNAGEARCAWALRITGYERGIPPAVAIAGAASTTTHTPPALTAPWGSADNLWLVYVGLNSDASCSGYPSGYTSTGTNTSTESDNRDRVGQGYGAREYAGATEDPGTFTNSEVSGVVVTIAVAPAGTTAPLANILTQGSVDILSDAGTTTQSVTLAAASDRRLVVAVGVERPAGNTAGVDTITYGEQSLSAVTDGTDTAIFDYPTGDGNGVSRTEFWELRDADMPDDGANDLVVTMLSTQYFSVGWWILSGASQAANVLDVASAGSTAGVTTISATPATSDGCAVLALHYKKTASGVPADCLTQTAAGVHDYRCYTHGHAEHNCNFAALARTANVAASSAEVTFNHYASTFRDTILAISIAAASGSSERTGQGACVAPAATQAATGAAVVAGAGASVAAPASAASTGAVAVTGSASCSATAAASAATVGVVAAGIGASVASAAECSATGAAVVSGSAAVTAAAATSASTGAGVVSGLAACSAPAAESAATGGGVVAGSCASAAAAATSAGTGGPTVSGSADCVAAPATSSATGTTDDEIDGVGVCVAPAAICAATGTVTASASASATAPPAQSAATAGATVAAAGAVIAPAASQTATAAAVVSCSGASLAPAAECSATGTVGDAPRSGVAACISPAATSSGTGTAIVAGSGAAVAPGATAQAVASSVVSGSAACTAPAATCSGTLTAGVETLTTTAGAWTKATAPTAGAWASAPPTASAWTKAT